MRYIISIAVLIIGLAIILILKKVNKISKAKAITYTSILLLVVAMPIDDFFMKFSTPEAYMKYYYLYTKPKQIIYGKDSCLVRATDDTGKKINIYLRSENGIYRMHYGWQSETIKRTDFGIDGMVETVRVKGTNDYYLLVYLIHMESPAKVILDDGYELPLEASSSSSYFGQMYLEDYKEGRYVFINGYKAMI